MTTCGHCGGSGRIGKDQMELPGPCHVCDGTGEYPAVCINCNGAGWHDPDCDGSRITCPVCNGKGRD